METALLHPALIRASLAAALISSFSSALNAGEVPGELFGVRLGETYHFADTQTHSFPISHIVATETDPSQPGLHIYFEPLKSYSMFPYSRRSFRLYVLPVIPDVRIEVENALTPFTNWKVVQIQWQHDASSAMLSLNEESSRYRWAKRACELVAADLQLQPDISDKKYFSYSCSFSASDDRYLFLSSDIGTQFGLSVHDTRLADEVETVVSSLMKHRFYSLRPYSTDD